MKKTLALILLASLLLLCSCALADNGITPFGDAAFAYPGMLIVQDISCFFVKGEAYYDIGGLAQGVKKGECIAALNGTDNYSYRFYRPADDCPDGILIVNAYSKINLAYFNRVYAAEDVTGVPAEMIDDFPHIDTLLNGGLITEMYGVKACRYTSTIPGRVTPGEKLFDFDGKDFFAFPDQPLWLLAKNEADPERYDLYYDADRVTELPGDVIRAIIEKP